MPTTTERSPWSRPGFIAAAGVVVILVLIAVGLGVRSARNVTAAAPSSTSSMSTQAPSATSTPTTAPSGDESVCGLKGFESTGTLVDAPTVEWAFEGTTAYPVSRTAGPGKTDDAGVRTCFQHTPEGALLAVANAIATPSDPTTAVAWLEQFVAQGPYREQILAGSTPSTEGPSSTRLNIAGFRLLAYSGTAARVDIGVRASANGTPVVGSYIYELVWQAGDWKLSADSATSFSFTAIPDLAGYTPWGA